MHVTSDKDLLDSDVPGHCSGIYVDSIENCGRGADFSLFDPSIFGLPEDGFNVDLLDDEESSEGSYGTFEALVHSAKSPFPKPGRRRQPKALAPITEKDFDSRTEKQAFRIVNDYARRLFGSNPDQEAVEFFFSPEDDGKEITFSLCCDVLRARADVFRLRVQYEFWLRGSLFTGPFPFSTVPVPQLITGEIYHYAGPVGYALAREVWVQPGIDQDELIEAVAELDGFSYPELINALDALQDKFILSKEQGWYLTGRNPLLKKIRYESIFGKSTIVGGTIYWSKLFVTAD